jgi:hypothetical protein
MEVVDVHKERDSGDEEVKEDLHPIAIFAY